MRVRQPSRAAGVISGSAACVLDELDPLPTVCWICICLRDSSRDSNFLGVSSVLFMAFVVFLLCWPNLDLL